MSSSSSRFAIAVHTLTALANRQIEGGPLLSSQEIAASVNTNPVVIRVLLRSLKAAGFVKAKEGKDGGFWLGLPMEEIRLGKVYQAVDTTGALAYNKRPENPTCVVSRGIKKVLVPIFGEVDQAVFDTLQKQTLKEVVMQIV